MKPNKLISIGVLIAIIVIACIFHGKPAIVSNEAVLNDADTLVYHDPVETVSLPFEYDAYFDGLGIKFDSRISSKTIISLDSLNVLTIYDPNITVIWDTTEVRK